MKIEGMAAIVSGGASGLGAATAQALAAAGAKVTVLDINGDLAAATARDIGGLAAVCDVTDAASAKAAIGKARDAHGPARIAVNCAGVGTAGRILEKDGPMALEAFARTITINLVGTFNILRLAADDMRHAEPVNEDGERGVIINTASVAAFEGQIGQSAYAASKGGIVGLTLPAARELARYGVRVLAIAPGIFLTPMLLGLPENVRDSLAANLPFPKRLGKPEEYAALALHMAQNAALNGEVVRLDSALRMQPQ